MNTDLASDRQFQLPVSEISPAGTWCPRCATFQPSSNSACISCGAAMERSSRRMTWQSKCVVGLVILFISAIFLVSSYAMTAAILMFAGIGFAIGALTERTPGTPMHAPKSADPLRAACQKALAREAKEHRRLAWRYGPINLDLICPHCQAKGRVHAKQENVKVGISGGKATAAVLTGGLSLLATGLSRKTLTTAAWCEACKSTWHF